MVQLELCLSAYVAYRSKKTQTPRKLIEEIDSAPDPPPKCPQGQFKMFMRIREAAVSNNISTYNTGVKVGTSPAMKTEGTKIVPVNSNLLASSCNNSNRKTFEISSPMPTGSNSIRSGSSNINTIAIPPLTASTPIAQTSGGGYSKIVTTTNRGKRIAASGDSYLPNRQFVQRKKLILPMNGKFESFYYLSKFHAKNSTK